MTEKKDLGKRREDRKPPDLPAPGPEEPVDPDEEREAGMVDGLIPL